MNDMSNSRCLVHYVKEGAIGIVTLDNPPLNVGTAESMQQFDTILDTIESDNRLRVVVLAARGRVFAAGSNMHEILTHLHDGTYVDGKMVDEIRVRNRIAALPVPTIAAMDGSAYGGGFDLALACDMRIAARHVVLSLPEVSVGSFPGSGSAYRLTRLIGAGRAIQHMLFGEQMPAARGLELGVVNAIPDTGTALELALSWARAIAAKSSVATRIIKAAVAGIFQPEQPWLDLLQLDLSRRIVAGGHISEGMRAFCEKREPRFD